MLYKILCLVVLLQVVSIYGELEYMIKNKKSGLVLDAEKYEIGIEEWKNKKSQLWTIKSSDKPGYKFFYNVGNGKVLDACPVTKAILTYPKHGAINQKWKLDNDDERLDVQFYPNHYVVHKNGKAILHGSKQNDDSDKWLLVEPSSVNIV